MGKQSTMTTDRKSNFELLRILAMLGIVIFHHFGSKTLCSFVPLPEGFDSGGYFYDVVNNSTSSLDFRSLVMDFCYGHFGNGGNLIFMLITGYFLYGKPFDFEKNIKSVKKILFTTLFGGCVLTLIFAFVIKFLCPIAGVLSFKPIFNLPNWLSGSNLWYFQAYGIFILFILPILKHFESKIDRKKHKLIIAAFVFLFFLDYKNYLTNLWLSAQLLQFIMCYYIGGYISKYSPEYNLKKLVLLLIAYITVYFLYEYYWRMAMRKMYFSGEYSCINVISPFICCLVFAVLVFLIFSKLNFSSRCINHIAKATPSIYVFHFNIISISFALANTYWWNNWSPSGYFTFILIDSAALFVIGYLIDLARRFIFSRLTKMTKGLLP